MFLFSIEYFFNYIVNKGNITILPQGYKVSAGGTDVDFTDLPHDFYLYSPAYTPFGLNKSSTIYSNGTTHILIYNDTTEPTSFYTINMTVTPSSDSVNVTVSNFTTSYKKWNLTSDNATLTVNHTIGSFTTNTQILIKKSGSSWNVYTSNSSGYIDFMYDEGFSDIIFEAEDAYCGDDICDSSESCSSCAGDCGACPPGDGGAPGGGGGGGRALPIEEVVENITEEVEVVEEVPEEVEEIEEEFVEEEVFEFKFDYIGIIVVVIASIIIVVYIARLKRHKKS